MTAPTAAAPAAYTFDNATTEAAVQVRLLADILDPHTLTVLNALEVQPGWECLDLGPGAGTITTALADLANPGGRVTAIDLDPRHMRGGPGIDIRTGDIRTTTLPANCYDLIHTRLLLMHLPQRQEIVRQLATALRPGGLLVISDWECSHPADLLVSAPSPQAAAAFTRFQTALGGLAAVRGADLSWARRVPAAMRTAGLVEITSETYNRLWAGGQPGCLLHASNSRQLHQPLLHAGMRAEDLTTLRQAMADPDTLAYSYLLYTTVGRKPS